MCYHRSRRNNLLFKDTAKVVVGETEQGVVDLHALLIIN